MTADHSLLVDRLEALHTHRVYRREYIAEMLNACGVEVALGDDGSSVIIAGMEVTAVEPEWGTPGISPQSLISAVYKTITGVAPGSSMIGRGFWYRDVLSQLREAIAHLPRSGSEPGTQLVMRNSFEALCTLADREQWCWNIHCGTCGHGVFRYGLSALSSGAHPESADWCVHWGRGVGFTEIAARMGPVPSFEDWPISQQRQLQRIIAEANMQRIAEECSYPDWLGYLGLALHYTEEAERQHPVISRSVAPQLGRLVLPGSEVQNLLSSRAAAVGDERLTWYDLGSVEYYLLRELRVPRRRE